MAMSKGWIPAKAVRVMPGGKSIQVIVPRRKNPAGAAYIDDKGRLRIVGQDSYWDDHWIDPEMHKRLKTKKAKKKTKAKDKTKKVSTKSLAKKKATKKR